MTYTTQQLQAMSDFDVNKSIALKLHPNAVVSRSISDDESVTIMTDEFTDIMVDYCNNHNDIMPLVFERRIAIFPHRDKWISAKGHSWIDFNGPHEELAPIDTDGEYFMSESPLRAIACLILLMED